MPKTEVILTANLVGLGAESDHVKVAPGYARNYLYPQGLAIPLTSANKRRLEVLRQRRAEREAHEYNTMSELAKSLGKLTCLVKVKTGDDGKMFGSVTSGTLADELKHQFDISLDKKKIHLDHPLKAVGDYEIELKLHPEVTTTLKVKVESTTPPPPPEEPKPQPGERPGRGERSERGERGDRGPRSEKRGPRALPGRASEPKSEASAAKLKPGATQTRHPRPEKAK